jgi:hypothetical protein
MFVKLSVLEFTKSLAKKAGIWIKQQFLHKLMLSFSDAKT